MVKSKKEKTYYKEKEMGDMEQEKQGKQEVKIGIRVR